jgi:protein phosphatase
VGGNRIILCTDGLWGVISENEMTEIIRLTSQPQQLCQELVNLANAAGGPDNISVILIDIPE